MPAARLSTIRGAARATARVVSIAAAFSLLAGVSPLSAQGNRRTVLTVTGFPLTVATTSADDFTTGSISFGSTSFSVDLTTNSGGGGFSPRVTTVNVLCAAGCPGTVAQVQWRRADLGVWNSLTTAPVFIEARTATFSGTNDPWSRSVEWRYLLVWATTPPAAEVSFPISFELVVTAP